MAERLWPRAWAIWAVVVGASFAVLEEAAFRRHRHKTLSRQLRALLGPRGCWVFAVLGLVFTHHLIKLQDLVQSQPET